jgi:hypothetical protein
MGTRSTIGVLNTDGSVSAVYCHWDGYPEYNGKILMQNYTTEEKVRELIGLGNLSLLSECGEPDVSDSSIGASTFPNVAEFVNEFGEKYNYLFINGTWFVNDNGACEQATSTPVFDMVEVVLETREVEENV